MFWYILGFVVITVLSIMVGFWINKHPGYMNFEKKKTEQEQIRELITNKIQGKPTCVDYLFQNKETPPYVKTWNLKDGYQIDLFRGFKGDLIELIYNDESIVQWVDQSYQYKDLLGINDFRSEKTLDEIIEILS